MKGYADIVFESNEAKEIYQALIPEQTDELQRSRVSLNLDDNCIRLRIEGDDIVSIRAALNTWIRLVKIAFEMASI
jgi:KEOPS complex subunit Pcc1